MTPEPDTGVPVIIDADDLDRPDLIHERVTDGQDVDSPIFWLWFDR